MSSNIGIGLGAFAEGFGNGIQLQRQASRAKAEQAAYDKEASNDAEMQSFDSTSKSEFEAGQKQGKYSGQNLADFMVRVKGPERAALMIKQGDYQGAANWKSWIESDAAKEGTQLFGQAMFQAKAGDVDGAIDTALKAGQVKGYYDHSLSFGKKEELKGPDGKVLGYRVHLKNDNGPDLVWDVDSNNVEVGIATLMNPEAAYQSRIAAEQERAKADLEVSTYGRKKQLDRKYDNDAAAKNPPADVATAKWLAQKTAEAEGRPATAQDELDAYKMVNTAKDNPNSRAALVVRIQEGFAKDPNDRRKPEEKLKAAQDFVNSLWVEDKPSKGDKTSSRDVKKDRSPNLKSFMGDGPKRTPIPDALKGEPEGTIIKSKKDGGYYQLTDGYLIPYKGAVPKSK